MAFNVAERILQLRTIEAKIKEEEDALVTKLKPLKEFALAARGQLQQYLNDTGQRSAATINGTVYNKAKTTWRVVDKEEFQRHVIGTESWGLITWAAAPTACETFTAEYNEPPPGVNPNTILVLHVNAPPKPRARKGDANVVVQEEPEATLAEEGMEAQQDDGEEPSSDNPNVA